MSTAARTARTGLAATLVAGLLVVSPAQPIAAQTEVEIPKGTKAGLEEPGTTLARLLDGWREAAVAAGEDAAPEAIADTLVAMLHQPLKDPGLGSVDAESQRGLKASLALAEERVRAIAGALSRAEMDEAAARVAVQRAIAGYLSALEAVREAGPVSPAGAPGR
jgi:hypothetical protein